MIQTWTGGERITATMLNFRFPMGEIGRGVRTTTKVLTGTEAGYLRIDGIQVYAGRSYRVTASGLRIALNGTPTANDRYKYTLRNQDASTAATTASPEIGRSEQSVNSTSTAANDSYPPIISNLAPGADAVMSFLLTAYRVSGALTGSTANADPGGVLLLVEDLGYSVGNNAINL